MSRPTAPVSSCPRSNKPARAAAGGYWQLVAAGEPFRLLFPVGAAIGIFSALVGVALQIIGQVAPFLLPESAAVLGRLLLNQGFLLLPIMGVGAFLLPRFFDLPSRQSFRESPAMPPEWGTRAIFALACGLSVLVGFILEARGSARWGCGLRAVAVVVYFARELPVYRAGFGGGPLAHAVRIALFSIPSGYVLMSIWPEQTTSLLHVVFITGLSLITLAVATRVVLGHSGQAAKFQSRLWPVIALAVLVVFAMLTRVSADWMPAIRLSHYAYAALIWAAGVLIWALAILPSVSKADKD